jgi:cytochrome c peroxidase
MPDLRSGYRASAAVLLSIGLTGVAGASLAAFPLSVFLEPALTIGSLKDAPVPAVPGIDKYVRDRNAAIVLGKALFWDQRTGSDGMACASCHYHAGADNRMKNALSPGLNGGDTLFDRTASGGHGPNYTLRRTDFPFHQLSDPLDRNSAVLFDTNDVVSSPGTFGGAFMDVIPRARDICGVRQPDTFEVGGIRVRHVEPRNTPTVINAAYNFRNFWDGRANNHFNGVSPFGPRDAGARILEMQPDGSVVPVVVDLPNSALASQSVGPPLSNFEMSCASRAFRDIAARILPARPLAAQKVARDDSVFGPAGLVGGKGLITTYATLVKRAFKAKYWGSTQTFDGYSQMEANFSLFWGVALQLYESTLVSDQAPIDRYFGDGNTPPDPAALTPSELHGLQVFQGKGLCITCHHGPTLAGGAAPVFQPLTRESTLVEQMAVATGSGTTLYDNGFYNIGVRPTVEDRGVGGLDPFGHPLSFTREYLDMLRGIQAPDVFPPELQGTPCIICVVPPNPSTARVAVDGAFKTPTLRNVGLTAPYFHNGGQLTLEQVVDFYNRGGDRRGPDGNDTTGLIAPDAPNGSTSNLALNIGNPLPLFLSATEKADLVAFLRNALTDPRVACEAAPFDHPELKIPNGHMGDEFAVVDRNRDLLADDDFKVVPVVGAGGLPAVGRPCLTR